MALRSPTSGKRKNKRKGTEASDTQEAVNRHGAMEVETALGNLGMGVKKRKRYYIREEMEAETMEPLAELPVPSATSSKRRKSKGIETSQVEHEEPVAQMEPPEGTFLSPTKKRKRQKKAEGTEEVAPVSPKKTKKKKGKWVDEAEVTEAALLADFEPPGALAPSKKKERGHLQRQVDF